MDELQEPLLLAPLVDAFQIRTDLDAFSVGMASRATLVKGSGGLRRKLDRCITISVIGAGGLSERKQG
jgi:hypothetical protein